MCFMKKTRIAGALLAALMMFSAAGNADPVIGVSISAEAASKLAAPKGIKASVSGSSITLKWKKVKGADAYRVYLREPDAEKYHVYLTTTVTNAYIEADEPGTYRFRVAAVKVKNGKYKVQTKSPAVKAVIAEKEELAEEPVTDISGTEDTSDAPAAAEPERTEAQKMTDNITVNTQSSIRIDTGSKIIRIDPYRIPGLPQDADIVFLTHAHYDHFSPDDLERVSKPGTVYVAPVSMKTQLEKAGIKDAILLSPGNVKEIEGITVEALRAYNTKKSYHPKSQDWLGYILTINGVSIYAAGDTDATPEAKKVKCDIALVPIGGTYTMDFREAAELINLIKPKIVIPIHYGSIVGSRDDGKNFKKLLNEGIETVFKL